MVCRKKTLIGIGMDPDVNLLEKVASDSAKNGLINMRRFSPEEINIMQTVS